VPASPWPRSRLTDGEVRARFDGLTGFLWRWGDVTATDAGGRTRSRLLEFRLVAPGEGLPPEVLALYREYFAATSDGAWGLAKYAYEYLDLRRGLRLAYHLHDLGGRSGVAHAHCQPATALAVEPPGEGRAESSDPARHLRSIEYDLREAHREFMRLYAADVAPDCDRFLPLGISRT
jgi:hypothetical protein